MRSRIPLPSPDDLTDGQRCVRDSILASRGNLQGPFLAWLHAPDFADPAERLGAVCRYSSGLALRTSELLILMTAAHFACDGEWDIHGPIAIKAGATEADLAAIREGLLPATADARELAILAFAAELLKTNRVRDKRFEKAEAALGAEGLVRVVGLVGYYALVAMTLNAFAMRADEKGPARS